MQMFTPRKLKSAWSASFVAFSYTCFHAASCASGTSGCSPMPSGVPRSPRRDTSSGPRRRRPHRTTRDRPTAIGRDVPSAVKAPGRSWRSSVRSHPHCRLSTIRPDVMTRFSASSTSPTDVVTHARLPDWLDRDGGLRPASGDPPAASLSAGRAASPRCACPTPRKPQRHALVPALQSS